MRIAVVQAGLGTPSSSRMLGERLGAAVRVIEPDAEIVEVSVREVASDVVNRQLTGVASPALAVALADVASADGLIAVSPVMNGSMGGLFKLFFEVLDEGVLRDTPVLLGATGGTVRHTLAIDASMVPLFHYLRARVLPGGVFAATDDWGTSASLTTRIDEAAAALVAAVRRAAFDDASRPTPLKPVDAQSSDAGLVLEMDFESMLRDL